MQLETENSKLVSQQRTTCPVARASDLIGDKWSLLIVRDAFDGISRFSDFHNSLGIARNILTARLRDLETKGVLIVAPAADGSAYKDYLLTDTGKALFPVVLAMRQWGEAQLFRKGEKHSQLRERLSGKVVPRMQVISTDGAPLGPSDTIVKKVLLHPKNQL
jgi:DNA-binding HxlR family transcriptional regulator